MLEQLGDLSELVICGFTLQNCESLAKHANHFLIDIIMDLELTEIFPKVSKMKSFQKDNYNPVRLLETICSNIEMDTRDYKIVESLWKIDYYKLFDSRYHEPVNAKIKE